jgi:tetratricopeptide (TPR) repeat protein
LVREIAGLTIREVAATTGVPPSTIGGYFGGAHLPTRNALALLDAVLRACGVTDPVTVDQWRRALRRARRTAPGANDPNSAEAAPPAPTQSPDAPPPGSTPPQLLSTRPPVERLLVQPRLRGRSELLGLLVESLAQPVEAAPPRVHVLHGLGGCGKSMVALALARAGTDRGVRTWWISAESLDTATAALRAVAVELGATPDQLRYGSPPDLLWRLLSDLTQPWLLIVDNADDPERVLALPGGAIVDGTGWLRPITGIYGAVVVTTRDGSPDTWGAAPGGWVRLHPVGRLDNADGALVLLELAGTTAGPADGARRLSNRLGGLPLALRLAGRYLGEAARMPTGVADLVGVRTFDGYLEALDRGQYTDLLAGEGETERAEWRNREIIGRTWELSLDLMDSRGMPQGRLMLRLLSCLAASPIPFALLFQPALMATSPLFSGVTPRRMWVIMRSLADLGLVDLHITKLPSAGATTSAADIVVVHPLVRDASRWHPDVASELPLYLSLITALLINATTPLDPRNPASWHRWHALAEHCSRPVDLIHEYAIEPADAPSGLLTPAAQAANYLRAAGYVDRAEREYTSLVEAGRRLLGDEHPEVLSLRHQLYRVWYDRGRYKLATRYFHALLADRRRVLGAEHPDTLTTAHYLGRALRDHGQLREAERCFIATLQIRRRVLGEIHADTLTSLNNVADVLRVRGRLDEAERLLSQVFEARRAALGEEHPATLVTCQHLASLTRAKGDRRTASSQLIRLSEVCERVLGPDHPRTMTARQLLAEVLLDLGRVAEAEHLATELLDRRHRVLGLDHPATLATRHLIGLILTCRGDLERAGAELAAVADARRQVLGARHPDSRDTQQRLDALRRDAGGRAVAS